MTAHWHLPLNSPVPVEVTVRRDFVELRYDGRGIAVIDRDQLREWLTQPRTQPLGRRFPVDDVTFTRLDHGHALLSITRAGVWTLAPGVVKALVVRL